MFIKIVNAVTQYPCSDSFNKKLIQDISIRIYPNPKHFETVSVTMDTFLSVTKNFMIKSPYHLISLDIATTNNSNVIVLKIDHYSEDHAKIADISINIKRVTFIILYLQLGACSAPRGAVLDARVEFLHPVPLAQATSDIHVHWIGNITGEDLVVLWAVQPR